MELPHNPLDNINNLNLFHNNIFNNNGKELMLSNNLNNRNMYIKNKRNKYYLPNEIIGRNVENEYNSIFKKLSHVDNLAKSYKVEINPKIFYNYDFKKDDSYYNSYKIDTERYKLKKKEKNDENKDVYEIEEKEIDKKLNDYINNENYVNENEEQNNIKENEDEKNNKNVEEEEEEEIESQHKKNSEIDKEEEKESQHRQNSEIYKEEEKEEHKNEEFEPIDKNLENKKKGKLIILLRKKIKIKMMKK